MNMSNKTRFEDVRSFHQACGLPVGDMAAPRLTHEEARFRARLILEEVAATLHALGLTRRQATVGLDVAMTKIGPWPENWGQQDADMIELAHGLDHVAYVVEGTAVQAGLPSEEVWHEVQRSNMAKAGAATVDGKLQKPDGWTPPDVAGVLERARKAAKG
jgi:predicted HAD superfamily Cof-like phosphohydrolase